jgi:hypothetical protein
VVRLTGNPLASDGNREDSWLEEARFVVPAADHEGRNLARSSGCDDSSTHGHY